MRWLIANHKSGGVMTYAGMSHIHVDIGYHFVALNAGGRRASGWLPARHRVLYRTSGRERDGAPSC